MAEKYKYEQMSFQQRSFIDSIKSYLALMGSQDDGSEIFRMEIDEAINEIFKEHFIDFRLERMLYASIFHFGLEEGKNFHLSKLKVFYEDSEYQRYEFVGFEYDKN
ncbi:hypothetical protein [Paenibacillus silvisoli]|uniref:hypothetical protein n=1 Tax=Paenibacillus silvisoli TaxID=3110539 RepID=UPI002804619B|nr:hypothetical protein [Paenibacillus silvisoli]